MLWIRRKILGSSANSNARFTFNVQQGQIVGGGQLKGYMNPFAMSGGPQEIPIMVHPNMGLVEDTRGNHPQAEAAFQLDGVHEGLPSWTAKHHLYLIEKMLFFAGSRGGHLWTAW